MESDFYCFDPYDLKTRYPLLLLRSLGIKSRVMGMKMMLKQLVPNAFLRIFIASVVMVLFTYSMLCAQAQTSGQPPIDPAKFIFETVSGDYGSIYNVIQDKDGFLWLAGINGAYKYNGNEADTIYSGETVSALFQDSEGLIWMVTRSEVAVYDSRTGKITKFVPHPNKLNALSGGSQVFFQKTQLFAEDRDGFIWIATMNGLNQFDKKSGNFTAYKSKAGDPATLLDNDVWSVLTAKDGSLWVGTATGLHKFDPRTGRVLERFEANVNDPKALFGKYVQATVEDNEGLVWAGTTTGGLNRLDPKVKIFSHYQVSSPDKQKIANNFIYRLACFQTMPQLIWIATADGLSILKKQDNTVINYIYNDENEDMGGLGGKIVHTIIQDKSGIFWLVVNEQGFLQMIDPGAQRFKSILQSKNPEEGFLDVSCPLRLGPDGNIWVNEVSTGIARVNPKTARIINHILPDPQKPQGFPASIEDFDFEPRHQDIIWVVAKGVVVEYNWKTQIAVNRYPSGTQSKVWPVWTDKQHPDLIYAGIWGEGLLKFNKRAGQAEIIAPDPAHPKESLSGTSGAHPLLPAYFQMEDNQIWLLSPGIGFDLFDLNTQKVVRKHLFNNTEFPAKDFETNASLIDSKGRFWMGQNQYDQANDKFTTFKSLYGYNYPAAYVSSTVEDKQGLLWNGSFPDGTLTRLNPQTGETKVFTKRDGISPGLSCSYASVILPDGQIWMAGVGGVTYFYPNQIVDNPYRPPVFITKLTQGGNPLTLGMAPERVEKITLNWDENFFEFEMAALSYRQSEKNQYQYILEGVDKQWYFAGTKHNGRYSGLPAGSFTLRIRGSNNDGIWSNREATLAVTIIPPWWGTWWFRGLVGLMVVSLIATAYRYRVRSLKRYSQKLESEVARRTRQLTESNEQLQIAKEQAESANRAKSTFLANMSHELRTPLNAILGFARLTKESPEITPELRKNQDIITLSGGHLLNLINNVLDISKIESGRIVLEEAPIDLYQLIQEMKSLLYVNAEERGLSFIVEQSPDLPRRMEVDGGKLRQALINLIGNAIKFTKQGGIILRAMPVKRKTAEKVWLRFEVEDTGPGISEDERKLIFKPFVQLKGRVTVETGTGLGLAICRQYINLMGGAIDVISEKGKGSLFYFEIPAKELPLGEAAIASERGRVIGMEKGQPRYRLLVAEDQIENRILLRKILEPFDVDMREATNGKEAVEIFEQWHPDLIWMDMRMPVMDGLEATHRIKSTDAGANTKVIAITAHVLEEDRVKIMQAGCDDFVRKPYRNTEIFNVLSRHLGLRFVYEEKPEEPTVKPELKLQPEQLKALPSELIQQLHQATIELDPERTLSLIEQITVREPYIGKALRTLAERDDYEGLQKILDAYERDVGGT
jgi:signal transduction histidine kinase/CheY-like chemotaxis protein/ligand-binding sensor domain-containing protein